MTWLWQVNSMSACFSDDTNLTMVSDNYLSLQTKVNCEIQEIVNWLKSNKRSSNYNKLNT